MTLGNGVIYTSSCDQNLKTKVPLKEYYLQLMTLCPELMDISFLGITGTLFTNNNTISRNKSSLFLQEIINGSSSKREES